MIKHIKKLLKEIYLSTETSKYQKNKTYDIFKNPTRDEFISFIRDINFLEINPFKNLYFRFIIDTSNGDLYIWDGEFALHEDVFKILRLKTNSYLGGNFCNGYKKYIIFDPNSSKFSKNPQLIISHVIHNLSKYIKDINKYLFSIEGKDYGLENNEVIVKT